VIAFRSAKDEEVSTCNVCDKTTTKLKQKYNKT